MDTEKWLLAELTELENATQNESITTSALLQATQQLVHAQVVRIEQAEAELDGRIWSPSKW
ncbi:hypothetical protein M3M38_03525 [Fructilactobacillus cliffordii]|uniref:hypothetical protein n=1 Tax=Fructilactobacillus cliffordii TaxID=2940299 RepID=UPI002093C9F2|nr:hypothetical protein [Fructilactobacillus cliffordii]USS87136.1 hypothetical protein M3M38_03525 [Fructilactobacillus cliffordii]